MWTESARVNDRRDRRAAAAAAAAPMLALLHICGVVRSPPRVSRRALVLELALRRCLRCLRLRHRCR